MNSAIEKAHFAPLNQGQTSLLFLYCQNKYSFRHIQHTEGYQHMFQNTANIRKIYVYILRITYTKVRFRNRNQFLTAKLLKQGY